MCRNQLFGGGGSKEFQGELPSVLLADCGSFVCSHFFVMKPVENELLSFVPASVHVTIELPRFILLPLVRRQSVFCFLLRLDTVIVVGIIGNYWWIPGMYQVPGTMYGVPRCTR